MSQFWPGIRESNRYKVQVDVNHRVKKNMVALKLKSGQGCEAAANQPNPIESSDGQDARRSHIPVI